MGHLGKVDERESVELVPSEFSSDAFFGFVFGEVRLAIILFDGVCNLCNAFIRWIVRRDRRAHFKFAALQSPVSQQILPTQVSPEMDTVLLVESGKIYMKSEAVLRIIQQLGGVGRLSPILRVIPRRMRDRIYDFIARNRYAWFGRRDQCMIPTEEVRSRFLDRSYSNHP